MIRIGFFVRGVILSTVLVLGMDVGDGLLSGPARVEAGVVMTPVGPVKIKRKHRKKKVIIIRRR